MDTALDAKKNALVGGSTTASYLVHEGQRRDTSQHVFFFSAMSGFTIEVASSPCILTTVRATCPQKPVYSQGKRTVLVLGVLSDISKWDHFCRVGLVDGALISP